MAFRGQPTPLPLRARAIPTAILSANPMLITTFQNFHSILLKASKAIQEGNPGQTLVVAILLPPVEVLWLVPLMNISFFCIYQDRY